MIDPSFVERVFRSATEDQDFFWKNCHPDLVLEMPFGASIGLSTRISDPEGLRGILGSMDKILPGVTFHNVVITPFADPNAFLLEYESDCPARNNYKNKYISIMRFKDNKLILLKEHFDTVEANRALR